MSIKHVYDLIDAANAIFDARNGSPAREDNDEGFEYDDPNHPAAVAHPHRQPPQQPRT